MDVVCSACKIPMGMKPGPEGMVSHSICRVCWPILYPGIPPFPECEQEWTELENLDGKK